MSSDTSSRKNNGILQSNALDSPAGSGTGAQSANLPGGTGKNEQPREPESGYQLVDGANQAPGHDPLSGNCHMRILMALRRIMHSVDTYSRKLSVDYRITVPQLLCLQTIVHDGPMTLSALGKLVSLSVSTVNGIIDRLEAKQLVERKRTDPDRRKVLVSATEAGVTLSRNTPLPLQNKLVQAISELPELEQVSIALSLERIVDMMEENQHPDRSGR